MSKQDERLAEMTEFTRRVEELKRLREERILLRERLARLEELGRTMSDLELEMAAVRELRKSCDLATGYVLGCEERTDKNRIDKKV